MTLPDFDKVHVKVERGKRPRLKVVDNDRFVLVTVPIDLTQNWPALSGNLHGGITIEVKKLEQQYKVSVTHLQSKKPEFSIFVGSLNHEHELRTVVKDLNTRFTYVAIGGPNMQVSGHLKADRIKLESTLGPLSINAKINANEVILDAQQLFVCPEAMIACRTIKMTSRKAKIDGKIYPVEECEEMRATFDVSFLHIGIDGTVGTLRGGDSKKASCSGLHRPLTPLSTLEATTASDLSVTIRGSLANYGKIVARKHLELNIAGTLLTLENFDSASRGFSAYRQINGIGGKTSDELSPTSSRLSSAIDLQSPVAVAELLVQGVDKNDAIERSSNCSFTPKRFALRRYKEISTESQRNSQRAKISQISALFSIHDWRRGVISAPLVHATIARDCQDCAQLKAEKLTLNVGYSAISESDSIWSCGAVDMRVGRDLTIDGQVKHLSWHLECVGTVVTSAEAIVSEEESARVSTKQFLCDGIWTVAKTMTIDASELCQMTSNSYLETSELFVAGDKDVELNGTWQTGGMEIEIGGELRTLSNGKCLVEKSARVRAGRLSSGGFWKVTDTLDLQLSTSADFLQFSVTEANLFKLVVNHHCTLGGSWMLGNLLAFIRKEFYTTCFGRCNLDAGTLAVGSFQNHCHFQCEQNLHIFAGSIGSRSIEQSTRSIIFVKDTFNLSILGDSLNAWNGRIVAHSLVLKTLRKCRFYGSIRVNELDVSTPYAGESQFVNSGQIEILVGPLVLKGNSAFEELLDNDLNPHPFPAFVLDGVLRAQAIIAPFLAVELSNKGSAQLSSLKSRLPGCTVNMLLTVGALHTRPYSVIDSTISNRACAERIVCATRFVHEGMIRFGGSEISVFADEIRNVGRLSSSGKKEQNHMRTAMFQIQKLLVNDAVMSADQLSISGEGRLVNNNRIFAIEKLHIRLSNFSNDHGELESRESLRLLSYSTTEWSRVGGSISAPNAAVGGGRICLAAKNFHKLVDEKTFISAKKDLRIATEMIDESMTRVIGFSARDSIHFEAPIQMEAIEIEIGELEEVSTVIVDEKLIAHRIYVTGNCEHLSIVLNGRIECRKLVFKDSIKRITITGHGSLVCAEEIQVDGEQIELALLHVSCGELRSKTIRIPKETNVRITNPTVSVFTEHLRVEGNLLLEGKLSVSPFGASSKITVYAVVIGTGSESELTFEADHLVIDGQFANLSFVEIFGHDRLELEPSFALKNVSGLAVDCQRECSFDGSFTRCQNVFVNADQLSVGGSFSNVENISFFAHQIDFNAKVDCGKKLVVSSKGSIYARGTITGVTVLGIDAKWLHLNCSIDDITSTTISAWSSVLQSKIRSSALIVRGLGVCLVSGDLIADECSLVIPFFVAVDSEIRISRMYVKSLVSVYRRPENSDAVRNFSSLAFVFDSSSNEQKILTRREMESWRLTCRQLKESFVSSHTLRPEEILIGVKYLGEVDPVVVSLPSCGLLESLQRIVSKFKSQQIGGFNCSKLIDVLQKYQNTFLFSNEEEVFVEKSKKKGKKRRSGSEEAEQTNKESLFDVIVSFKKASEMQRRPSKTSTDSADIGYASRSSSEDLDSARVISPEMPKEDSLKLTKLEEEEIRTDIDFHKTLEECETEYKAMCSSPTNSEAPLFTPECAEDSSEAETDCESIEQDDDRDMDFVISHGCRIPVLPIDFDKFRGATCPPSPPLPVRTPSRHDLVMKKLQVKQNLSTFDLKSFSSMTSLDSIETDMGTPMRFAPSPLRRSLIPRLSARGSHSLLNV